MRENFLLLIKKASSTGQADPLHEPHRLEHFLLRGRSYRHSAELAKLKFSKRGMLAPIAAWAIKSLMWQRPLGLSSLLIARMLHFSLLPWMGVMPSNTHSPVVAPSVGPGDDLRSQSANLRIHYSSHGSSTSPCLWFGGPRQTRGLHCSPPSARTPGSFSVWEQ